MHILVVNDDGIDSEGLAVLAESAKEFGDVTVVAPTQQCSAMSLRITVFGDIAVRPAAAFPVDDVSAYSITGTPADCVKVGLYYLTEKPYDIVFSGINKGINTGLDICYSGTCNAGVEALFHGVPAIAWSQAPEMGFDLFRTHFSAIAKELMENRLPKNEIWNVNFPDATPETCKGILRERVPAPQVYYHDNYQKKEGMDGAFILTAEGYKVKEAPEGTDLHALLNGYISIGTYRNPVLLP